MKPLVVHAGAELEVVLDVVELEPEVVLVVVDEELVDEELVVLGVVRVRGSQQSCLFES